jgi:signal transduction histidine kinase
VTPKDSVWRAMAGNPLRFLFSAWPWRCVAYLVTTVAVAGAVWGVFMVLVLFPPVLVLLGLPVGALERRRLLILEPAPAVKHVTPHATPPPGIGPWLRVRLTESATWRELGYTACLGSVLMFADLIAVFMLGFAVLLLVLPITVAIGGPIGGIQFQIGDWDIDGGPNSVAVAIAAIPMIIFTVYGLSAVAGGQAAFTKWVLSPTQAELSRRVEELSGSRTRLVNAFEAERRRIERDLHDGAQQHLVLLTMKLGLAQLEIGDDQSRAGALVAEAHQEARQALTAIREQIHGIHPQILTDLGLGAAVGELAERCRVPVEPDVRLPHRLPAAVESTAYFVISEALTNAVKHARAARVTVGGRLVEGRLIVIVTDDGVGGADPARGTGLRGLVDRASVMDGTLAIISPVGGPTTLRLELPCRYE